MADSEVEQSKIRVARLEHELDVVKKSASSRGRITQMSAEVVDSNPYRYQLIGMILRKGGMIAVNSVMVTLVC